jgi:hypothetical protein
MARSGRTVLILLALVTGSACVQAPERYWSPLAVYEPHVERLSVRGFERSVWVPTGGATTVVTGSRGLYAVGRTDEGEYRSVSDARFVRYLLEDTRCVRVVDEETARDKADLWIEGHAEGRARYPIYAYPILVLEWISLTAFLGAPAPAYANGVAEARVYNRGELVESFSARAHLDYASFVYGSVGRHERAGSLVKAMAMRDLADQVASFLCERSPAG